MPTNISTLLTSTASGIPLGGYVYSHTQPSTDYLAYGGVKYTDTMSTAAKYALPMNSTTSVYTLAGGINNYQGNINELL